MIQSGQGFAPLLSAYFLTGLWHRPCVASQFSPVWQKWKRPDEPAWHSQVFLLTRPSGQWAKRLNRTAAEASYIVRHVIEQMKAANAVFFNIW